MVAKKKVKVKVEDKVILDPVYSRTNKDAWWNEVGSKMEGTYTDPFIVFKATEAFGVGFNESRYKGFIKDSDGKSLKNRVMAVWDSHA